MSANLRRNGDHSPTAGDRTSSERMVNAARSSTHEIPARDFLRIIYRHKGKAFCFFTATMLAVAAYAFYFPKTYRSEAKLFVKLGRENAGLDATTTLGQAPSVSVPIGREEEINTEVEILGTDSLLLKVVDKIGPPAILAQTSGSPAQSGDLPEIARLTDSISSTVDSWSQRLGLATQLTPRERALIRLKKQIGVEPVRKANVIAVSHEGPRPEVSQQVVATLIDFYLEEHAHLNRTRGARGFMDEQAAGLKSQLARLEEQIRHLKNETGIASPAEQRQTLVAQIGRLEDELKATNALAAAAQAESRELATQLTGISETQAISKDTGHPNVAADGMRQQLYTLQLKERELASRVTDRDEELKLVREQIASAQKIVDSLAPFRTQTTIGPNRIGEEGRLSLFRQKTALASLRAKASMVQTQLAETREQLKSLNNHEMRIGQLQREIQILDANYRKYSDSLEQARVDEALEKQRISNINVAQPPTLSRQPVRPRKLIALALGFVIAFFGGLAIPLVTEYLDPTFRSSDEIESRLDLPVLVSIPQMKHKHLILRRRA
jgi:polysaccharide biosynthesis protein PslE